MIPSEDYNKLVEIRIKSKMGERLTPEEMLYCEEMYNKYPEYYPSNEMIFKITEKYVNPMAEQDEK